MRMAVAARHVPAIANRFDADLFFTQCSRAQSSGTAHVRCLNGSDLSAEVTAKALRTVDPSFGEERGAYGQMPRIMAGAATRLMANAKAAVRRSTEALWREAISC